MQSLTAAHMISIFLTLAVVLAVGIYAGKKVTSASDFSVGGRSAGVAVIAGTIIGTVVGGASTIGTAQLAFKFGLSAWWFTLGAGLGCLALAVVARPLRESEENTLPGFLTKTYGDAAGPLASTFSSLGIFLNIIGQILAATALITAMTSVNPLTAAIITVILIIGYVMIGGVWGTGLVGVAKLILLYISLVAVGSVAYLKSGGLTGIQQSFPAYPWFSLFGRGFSVDLAAGFSLVVGLLSTQTYIQAMFSGRSVQISRRGALLSALLIPPTGIAGILVGLYMKANFPHINAAEAFPLFVLSYLPPWFGGIVLGTLLIAVVGTGAGLTLGISTMLTNDIYKKLLRPEASDRQVLLVSRLAIIGVVGITLFFVSGNMKSLILQWSFLSMGLRGAAICLPLLGAIFFKDKMSKKAGLIAIAVGPLATLFCKLSCIEIISPLFFGLGASLLVLLVGSFAMQANTAGKYKNC